MDQRNLTIGEWGPWIWLVVPGNQLSKGKQIRMQVSLQEESSRAQGGSFRAGRFLSRTSQG